MRQLFGTEAQETVQAQHLSGAIDELEGRYPGIRERLTEPDGGLRRWVNVFVDRVDVRDLEGIDTMLRDGSEVYIVQSVAGG